MPRRIRQKLVPVGVSRRVWKALTGVILVAGLCGAASVPTTADTAYAGEESVLRVGIATNYPPLAFKQDGAIKGVEADFAAKLGPALGDKVELVELPWDQLIPALRDKRIDVIMSGMSITKQRQQLVSFTQPYMTIGQMALIRKADSNRLRDRSRLDVHTLRVGFVTGTTGEAYVRKHLAGAQLKGFDTVDAGVAALRMHEIDIFIHDAPAIWRVTGGFNSPERELEGRYEPLTEEELAWAVRKDDVTLRKRLNAVLTKWKADGEIESVLDHWAPVRKRTVRLKPAS
jgi:ABC-type amino acid transport substrate-binding protein